MNKKDEEIFQINKIPNFFHPFFRWFACFCGFHRYLSENTREYSSFFVHLTIRMRGAMNVTI